MKKTIGWCITGILLLAGIFLYYMNTDVPSTQWNVKQTSIEIEKDSIMLGTIKYSDKKNITFHIKNTGQEPLIIRDVRPSCGCTSAQWDKHPIKPGKITEISLRYEPNSLGKFIKSIDIFCNTPDQIHQVRILGQVEEE